MAKKRKPPTRKRPDFDPRWLTSNVVDLFASMDEEAKAQRGSLTFELATGRFIKPNLWTRFPILADALMDAGCNDDLLFQYLRDENRTIQPCRVWKSAEEFVVVLQMQAEMKTYTAIGDDGMPAAFLVPCDGATPIETTMPSMTIWGWLCGYLREYRALKIIFGPTSWAIIATEESC